MEKQNIQVPEFIGMKKATIVLASIIKHLCVRWSNQLSFRNCSHKNLQRGNIIHIDIIKVETFTVYAQLSKARLTILFDNVIE